MKIFDLRALIGGALFLSACVTTVEPSDVTKPIEQPEKIGVSALGLGINPNFTWQVSNNFRVLDGAAEQARYERDLALFLEAVHTWSNKEARSGWLPNILYEDLVQPDPQTGLERNYSIHYDANRQSYLMNDGDAEAPRKLALDPDRTIRLNWVGESGFCRFVVTDKNAQSKDAFVFTALCDASLTSDLRNNQYCDAANTHFYQSGETSSAQRGPACLGVQLGHSYSIEAFHLDTQSSANLNAVEVKDKLVVALGDSFSAGEGNPHMQWSLRGRSHPTTWMDQRCHRSLISGPGLAATFYATLNRHESVTLLHYGCSGASIDDGVARPWALQETSEQRQQVQDFWLYRFLGYEPEPKDIPRCVGTSEAGGALRNFATCRAKPGEKNAKRLYADLLPSQISLAVHDLNQGMRAPPALLASARTAPSKSGASVLQREPDIVILSVGGNDVGFQELVSGIVTAGNRSYDFKPCKFRDLPDESDEICGDQRAFMRLDAVRFKAAANIKRTYLNCILKEADKPVADYRLCHAHLTLKERSTSWRGHQISIEKKDEILRATRELLDLGNSETKPSKGQLERAHFIIGAMIRIEVVISDQYELLANTVNAHLQPDQVLTTLYPQMVAFRSRKAAAADADAPSDFDACRDAGFDGRPGMVPGFFSFLDVLRLGASKPDVRAADRYVLSSLNGSIADAVEQHGTSMWKTIDKDAYAALTRPYGFCSVEGRFINTVVDSWQIQGLAGSADELPIGNIGIAGKRYEWSHADEAGYYEILDGGGVRRLDPETQPVNDRDGGDAFAGPAILDRQPTFLGPDRPRRFLPTPWLRTAARSRPLALPASELSKPSAFPPRGTFHPTALGHCAYAAAILEELIGENGSLPHDKSLYSAYAGGEKNWRKSLLETLCSAETLGWSYDG